ncbi:MAG: tRNA (adenosine(37)-N6)-dimethylallyltransferase MiaA [Dehalococcoidales bacterium]|nr:tRNA (adenosine(37)-N6)-dimethylallyltransferase MiaA [Dehalococcoidales bacterium]
MNDLVAIVGPTAIGKSRLAIHLARKFNGDIVSADSRQVYRHMDIGTGKPAPEDLALVPHHLVSIVNPDEPFTLAQYQSLAYETIRAIQDGSKLPFLVGGSGLYVWTVLDGWKIPRVAPDAGFREKLEKQAKESGAEALYQTLVEIDPQAARKIDPHNVRRIIRALEVFKQTNTPFSQFQKKEPPPYRRLIIGLTAERAELYRRVDDRVDDMVRRGLVDEVEKLVKAGYNFDLPSMSSIGYRQIGQVLKGEINLEEAARQIKTETHRFVRHQYAWFRLKDERIRWFDVQRQSDAEMESEVARFLGH